MNSENVTSNVLSMLLSLSSFETPTVPETVQVNCASYSVDDREVHDVLLSVNVPTPLPSLFPIGTYVTMARTPYFPNRHISDDG